MQMDKEFMYFAPNFPNHYITINEAKLVMNDTCNAKTLIIIKLDIHYIIVIHFYGITFI
jgi:hypothetical protein